MQRVAEASEWFVRTPSLRLLYILTDNLLRLAVLEHVTATELFGVNASPLFVLEAPTESDHDGWTLRCEELRADWAGLVDTAAQTGVSLAPLWPEPIASNAFERFCLELHMALHAAGSGLVLVLAPVWILDRDRWQHDLSTLLGFELLDTARFIVVECGGGESLPFFVRQLGPLADILDARVQPEVVRSEMRARIEAMLDASPDDGSHRLTGAAAPRFAPPPREGASSPSPEFLVMKAQQLGISPALLDGNAMHQLRVSVFGAALAMADSDVDGALAAQMCARDFFVAHGLAREAVVSELVLGGFALQAGERELANGSFVRAHQRASEAGLSDLVDVARLVMGLDELEET
jgi:hypothetical protein